MVVWLTNQFDNLGPTPRAALVEVCSVFRFIIHSPDGVVVIGDYSWPAISDIWLGVGTVPVLSVAKEVAAPARSPTGRGAPEHRLGRLMRTD